jgi:transcriptional regulator with XRE-family HTH domain
MALGEELRKVRAEDRLGLREVATKAGVTHGYLSQLERGEIAQPAPQVLHKLAIGYERPFVLLMEWAGYLEPSGLTANQHRALNYMGDDVTDEELNAIDAVLKAIRGSRAGYSIFRQLDAPLTELEVVGIRKHAIALLEAAGVHGTVPTPIDEVMRISKLVSAGEITLNLDERRRLRDVFGSLADSVLRKLWGVIHFPSREVWVNPDLPEQKVRFVRSHEVGHYMLPWHRDLFAYLDDSARLKPEHRDKYEREANQAAIELLAQGEHLNREADDYSISLSVISNLAKRYALSMQATARRVVEESRKEHALLVSYRGSQTGKLMPPHVYVSGGFERRFGRATLGSDTVRLVSARSIQDPDDLPVVDLAGKAASFEFDLADTPRARFLLVTPKRRGFFSR